MTQHNFFNDLQQACIPVLSYIDQLINPLDSMVSAHEQSSFNAPGFGDSFRYHVLLRVATGSPYYQVIHSEFEGEGKKQSKITSLAGRFNPSSFSLATSRLGDANSEISYNPVQDTYSTHTPTVGGSSAAPITNARPSVLARPLLALHEQYKLSSEFDTDLFRSTCKTLCEYSRETYNLINRKVYGQYNDASIGLRKGPQDIDVLELKPVLEAIKAKRNSIMAGLGLNDNVLEVAAASKALGSSRSDTDENGSNNLPHGGNEYRLSGYRQAKAVQRRTGGAFNPL